MRSCTPIPLVAAVLLAACSPTPQQSGAQRAAPAMPVAIAKAVIGSAPIDVRAIGNVEPIASVVLRPQIVGQIVDLPAGEGVDVEKGAVIALIDTRPFEAALNQAEAEAKRDAALAADARAAAAQYADALVAKAMAKRVADEAEAKALAAEASHAADLAAVQTAKLNLEYCRIVAPFAGRLGSLMIKRGAVVKANETDIVDLVQITPIHVSFAIPEDRLSAVQAGMARGALPVRAEVPGDTRPAATGTVTFVDSRVDAATGTIRLKATFTNEDRRLWPGQFVNAVLTLGREDQVILVPTEAVTASQEGRSIWVVKPDQTVEFRRVTVGRAHEGRTVIVQGISEGDVVVTDGQLRLAPGSKVEPKKPPALKAEKTPASESPSIPAKDKQ